MIGSNTIEPLTMAPREADDDHPETSFGAVMQAVPPPDPTAEQYLKLIEISGALDFWERPEEDVYSAEDGEPV